MLVLLVLQGLVLALLVVLVGGLLRSHADILRKLHDLGAGDEPVSRGSARAPVQLTPGVVEPRSSEVGALDVSGTLVGGGERRMRVAGRDAPTLLAFLSTGCTTCAAFWDRFGRPEPLGLPDPATRLVIVTKDRTHESPSELERIAPDGVATVMSSQSWSDYGVPGSPYFMLLDGPTGAVLGEGSGTSWDQVRGLLRTALADAGHLDGGVRDGRVAEDGAAREARADAELRAAGVEPGDPSLFPELAPEVGERLEDAS